MEENKKAEQEHQPQIIPEKIPAVNEPEETVIPETESIKAEENPEPVNPKLSTEETMEVHHHGHIHEKKKWKEYVFQFFMLFLAVFCGFLAEYQLEHVIEKNREKQYMSSFLHDLKNDTLNLYEGFPRKDLRIKTIDSIFLFFENNPDVTIIPGSVYRQMNRTLWDRHYRRNSTTVDQLKNAGGMRLIRKKSVADSIAAYDLEWQRAEFYREAYVFNQEKGKVFIEEMIKAADVLPIHRFTPSGAAAPASLTDGLTVRINRERLNAFLNHLASLRSTVAQDKRTYEGIAKKAERLMNLIKKEYDLE